MHIAYARVSQPVCRDTVTRRDRQCVAENWCVTGVSLGLPDGSPQNTGHWPCKCLLHKLLCYLHMYCPVRITINIIPDTDLKYRTVRLNTGYLPTLTTVVTVNKNVMLTFRLPCYLL